MREPDPSEEEAGRLRAYFDASPVATLVFTPDLVIRDVNAPHIAMTGVARERVVGRFIFDAFPKNPTADGLDTEAVIRESVARVMARRAPDEVPVQRHDLPREDGGFESRFWRMVHSPVLRAGEIVAIRQDAWDVTDAALRRRNDEIQRRAASTLGDIAFWELDPETGALRHSGPLEQMFGMATGEAGGLVAPFRARMDPDGRAAAERLNAEHLRGAPNRPGQVEYDVLLPEGERRHLAMRSEGSLAPDGRRIIVGTTIDVTQLRRHEAELKTALDGKAALLVEVNHRVKNSLQLVASILSIGARSEPAPSVREKLASAAERVRAVASVHAQLYREDDVRRVDLGAQLPAFCAQLAGTLAAQRPGISLELDIDHARVPTETAVAISLIVNELVTNAYKHAFDGPERPEAPRVRVSLKRAVGEKLLLSVADNGIGGSNGERITTSSQMRAGMGRENGLGMRLVTSLVAQLGADLTHADDGGRRTDLTFPA